MGIYDIQYLVRFRMHKIRGDSQSRLRFDTKQIGFSQTMHLSSQAREIGWYKAEGETKKMDTIRNAEYRETQRRKIRHELMAGLPASHFFYFLFAEPDCSLGSLWPEQKLVPGEQLQQHEEWFCTNIAVIKCREPCSSLGLFPSHQVSQCSAEWNHA